MFDVVWSEFHQCWFVRKDHLRWIGDKILLRNVSEKESNMVCNEANLHRYRGSDYYGWIPPHKNEIEAIIEQAIANAPHRSNSIRQAILTACESFASANANLAPKLRVIEVLAHQVLPAFELEYQRKLDGSILEHEWQEHTDQRMENVCSTNEIVPSNRWWIQDMLRAYQEIISYE